jgi:hypothetical protein
VTSRAGLRIVDGVYHSSVSRTVEARGSTISLAAASHSGLAPSIGAAGDVPRCACARWNAVSGAGRCGPSSGLHPSRLAAGCFGPGLMSIRGH